jgi:hypothetical protein
MKTDRVLTMSECLASWYGGVSCVKPPADDARHIPVTSEENIDRRSEEHGCRCDRYGHPACLEERKPGLCAAADELFL